MGVEIIHHEADHFRFRVFFIDQPLHLVREILHRSPLSHGNVPPSRGEAGQEQDRQAAAVRLTGAELHSGWRRGDERHEAREEIEGR